MKKNPKKNEKSEKKSKQLAYMDRYKLFLKKISNNNHFFALLLNCGFLACYNFSSVFTLNIILKQW